MPGGDRTGPVGMGPMTGRGAGYCAGFQVPGFANPVAGSGTGYGFGRGGRGGGRGRRNMYYATGVPGWQRFGAGYPPYGGSFSPAPTKQQELDMLKGQADYFEDALEEIKKRITHLEAESRK